MSEPYAKVIEDSISPRGDRLTTIEINMHRFVLAEFNTHRSHSRNSASSRAIPFSKQVDRLVASPAIPLEWATEQRGMQGGDELNNGDALQAELIWLQARDYMIEQGDKLDQLGVHKSIKNRLLEPFMWHTVIATATDAGWQNFFAQRCSPLAQPEIRVAAELARETYDASKPHYCDYGGWHLPYVDNQTYTEVVEYVDKVDADTDNMEFTLRLLRMISTARCARVSYLTHDGTRAIEKDLELYDKLVTADPPHWSPLEHVATPAQYDPLTEPLGNFDGWHQLRHLKDYQ